MKYKLKENVNIELVNKKSIMKFNFPLKNYYDEKTRIFTFPEAYISWHLMAEVFRKFLEPLNLVEKVEDKGE